MNSIHFGKLYLGTTNVKNLREKQNEEMDFVQYEYTNEDKTEIEDTVELWKNKRSDTYENEILDKFTKGMDTSNNNVKVFGLEDKNGDIQALCCADTDIKKPLNFKESGITDRKNRMYIDYLTINPKNIYGSHKRIYSGLGARLFSEIVNLARYEEIDYIAFQNGNDDFWDTMPCVKKVGLTEFMVLPWEYYKDCINKINKKFE